ncbi:MAG: YqeG family HAD IIIA-type phosphatase [Atopobiaceae bacterium]|jgi:HAD superfamily phosphatase (TIGR01668 family)|nr:YqeG family HAD IIIA-type phosphatase [Atopobiaceae bacterium]MCI2173420.1 YqeG family HAD IIIA-type phosphatase [Atopobiaceae bacterium]MCI2207415.1 YqeG family HAD IIIA-type phosphatase [Atopobiaceae bacterium]
MGLLRATRYVADLPSVDLDALVGEGVRCVLLDRDNTCVPRDAKQAPADVLAWLEHARDLGLRLCLVSNNFHSGAVSRSADELGCDAVDHAMKPAPFAVTRALELEGVPAEQAVLVGDQVFTDVVAGNLAHVRTILVRPQSRQDLWYTQVFRVFERMVLSDVEFEGEHVVSGDEG